MNTITHPSYMKVVQWVEDINFAIDMEGDLVEKKFLMRRRDNIQQNLPYYIKGQLEKDTPHHFCVECGQIEFGNYSEPTKSQLNTNKLCFGCNHWKNAEAKHLTTPKIIVDGKTYGDGGNKPNERNKSFLGFGGSVFHIRMLDGSKEWKTNNLWCGGDIPKKYRETTMKDNAEFIREPLPNIAEIF